MLRKKNTEHLDFFYEKQYTKEKARGVIIMLKKFSVENFKGFKDKITLDIGNSSNYGFHPEVVKENCITKGIIYGINGCGKSNLGLAIFDVITLSLIRYVSIQSVPSIGTKSRVSCIPLYVKDAIPP